MIMVIEGLPDTMLAAQLVEVHTHPGRQWPSTPELVYWPVQQTLQNPPSVDP
ncbi:hypothetical protein ABVK25_011154 [Lepraria finkii]|uniref:Uncharacterized protein n=1 Tax=Lepraria finkii TaxID=1340010 RepID=A0ABR4AQI8_9LECA